MKNIKRVSIVIAVAVMVFLSGSVVIAAAPEQVIPPTAEYLTDLNLLSFIPGSGAEAIIREVAIDRELTQDEIELYNNYFTDEIKQLSYAEAKDMFAKTNAELDNLWKEQPPDLSDGSRIHILTDLSSMLHSYLLVMATGEQYLLDRCNFVLSAANGLVYLAQQERMRYSEGSYDIWYDMGDEQANVTQTVAEFELKLLEGIDASIKSGGYDRAALLHELDCILGFQRAYSNGSLRGHNDAQGFISGLLDQYNGGKTVSELLGGYAVYAQTT